MDWSLDGRGKKTKMMCTNWRMRLQSAMMILVAVAVITGLRGVQGQDLGSWLLLLNNSGIASMHTALTHYNTFVLLDRTNIGASQIALAGGACRDSNDLVLKHDCTAHSVLFDPSTNTVRPLTILTDTWCSSGQFQPDGTLLQTGGDYEGVRKVRTFTPCPLNGTCDWVESTTLQLQAGRWYATNQLLPDGTQIIIGGRSAFNLEYMPANSDGVLYFPFLNQTNDAETDNLYPYVHLLPDGTLYIFANQDSIQYNYLTNTVVKTFPQILDTPRNYPAGGSSVMLPLLAANQYSVVEILVCGGSQAGAYLNPAGQLPCVATCGRMTVTDANPFWTMETMPIPRCMGDMIILPTRDVIIINGAQQGSQGWGNALNPAFSPVVYSTYAAAGARFTTMAPTNIARMYHSTANLMQDGRIFLAGSNPHQFYVFDSAFPTELRLESYSPPYMSTTQDVLRPSITIYPNQITYSSPFAVTISTPTVLTTVVELNLVNAPFATHSFQQGQRLINLNVAGPVQVAQGNIYQITATAPLSPNIAPPAYYMMFAVNQGIPSQAVWMQLSS